MNPTSSFGGQSSPLFPQVTPIPHVWLKTTFVLPNDYGDMTLVLSIRLASPVAHAELSDEYVCAKTLHNTQRL